GKRRIDLETFVERGAFSLSLGRSKTLTQPAASARFARTLYITRRARAKRKMNRQTTNEPLANMRELLERRAAATPDKIFLFSEMDGRHWTYAEFDAAVNQTANMLAAHGIAQGDVVSLLLPNSAEYIIAYFACFKLGALAGPVNSLLKGEEIEYVVNNSEAQLLLVNTEFRAEVDAIRERLHALNAVIEFDDYAPVVAEFAATPDETWRERQLTRADEAIIIYTSGTTGKPKGCLLTHGNLLANAWQITKWLQFTKADRLLTVMPLFHMNAVMVTTIAALCAGGSSVVSSRFSASRFWQIVSDYQITSVGTVATMLTMLLARYPAGVPAGLKTDQLRFCCCGSAPVPAEVIKRFEETFGALIIEGYGLSESTVRATFNPPDKRRRPGSCGVPIGNEMRVVDEADREVPTGERGEIVLRGENIFKGYFKNDAATEQAFRGGWFHTSDIGYKDADGFFYIV